MEDIEITSYDVIYGYPTQTCHKAIHILHKPSGIIVDFSKCIDEPSNRIHALRDLQAKVDWVCRNDTTKVDAPQLWSLLAKAAVILRSNKEHLPKMERVFIKDWLKELDSISEDVKET